MAYLARALATDFVKFLLFNNNSCDKINILLVLQQLRLQTLEGTVLHFKKLRIAKISVSNNTHILFKVVVYIYIYIYIY